MTIEVKEVDPFTDPLESLSPDNVRLITFGNGVNVIAQIVDIEGGDIIALLPMEIVMEFDGETMRMTSYELSPYMDNLYPFNLEEPLPVFFNEGMVVSMSVPTVHLFRNYYLTLRTMQEVYDEEAGIIREDPVTLH